MQENGHPNLAFGSVARSAVRTARPCCCLRLPDSVPPRTLEKYFFSRHRNSRFSFSPRDSGSRLDFLSLDCRQEGRYPESPLQNALTSPWNQKPAYCHVNTAKSVIRGQPFVPHIPAKSHRSRKSSTFLKSIEPRDADLAAILGSLIANRSLRRNVLSCFL